MASANDKYFGLFIRSKAEPAQVLRSPVAPMQNDSAIELGSPLGGYAARTIGLDNTYKSENMLINKYRDAASNPVIDDAVEQIVSEAIVNDDDMTQPINLTFPEKTKIPTNLQRIMTDELDDILSKLDFRKQGGDIFRRWYVDGRIYFHKVIDETNPQAGIMELRYIDPRKLKMVREYVPNKNPNQPIDQYRNMAMKVNEFWIFNDAGIDSGSQSFLPQIPAGMDVIRFSKDAIAFSTSGLWDPSGKMIISHLHKALRTLNQFRMIEDSIVIYRVLRSTEKRKFLIDTGNLPKAKAEQSFRDIMHKFKNRLTYNSSTGEVNEDRRFVAMTEDYWFSVRDGSQNTDVEMLEGGQNLGIVEDLQEFKKQLFASLNVPVSRLNPEQQAMADFSGGGTVISRDELRFSRWIKMIRGRFSMLFEDLLRTQLVLKGIMSADEFDLVKSDIIFDYAVDSYFAQLKEIEILNQRILTLTQAQPLLGLFFSKKKLMRTVLELDDAEIEEELEQMAIENQQMIETQAALNAIQSSDGPPADEGGSVSAKPIDVQGLAVPNFESVKHLIGIQKQLLKGS